ncbi:hypothetical protein MJT46_015127 [Ovis ammon polii x Ovis aries]|nr:hypothetical protein MJT46_015127 [Ovis ammon polii x Ovis aries]
METKGHLFFQGEENTDSSDDDRNSSAADLLSRDIDSKKYIKFSKTTEKRISPEIRGLSPEHTKKYETSMFLLGEERSSDFSEGKKGRRKKSLQVQLRTKRTEVSPLSVKEKMTRKESSLCKLPSQYSIHKTLSPLDRSPSVIRKDERLSNLYQTLYDEVPEGRFYSEELSGLQKACKIFSKIRGGKIYVNDLPMIHRILKISISDTEMRKALKTVDIDVNGMLDFSDFLKAVNDVCYLVSQDPAFQNALKIFHRIKGGRVPASEVDKVLDSMDILVVPETLQEVIKYANINSNQMVDIGDIIFTLDELQQEYENISIMEGTASDEATSRKLSNVSGCYPQYRKKSILSSGLSESSLFQKLNTKSLQNHKIMSESDDYEFKRPKNTLQIRKFQDEVDSRYIDFQEPYSKDGRNFKKSSEKVEIHDSKSKPQDLKHVSGFKKSLDKSDIFSIPKLQKPAVRRSSSLLKQVSSKERTAINALESGMVKLDDFVSAVSKEQNLPEYDVLTDIIKAIDKIKDENIDYGDLNISLQNLGVYLSKPEFQKITELTEVGEGDKVQIEEFAKVVKEIHDTSKLEESQETILAVDLPDNDMIPGKNLEGFLGDIGIKLPKEEVEKILQSDFVSEDSMVNVKDYMKTLSDTQKFSSFIGTEDPCNIVNSVSDGKVAVKDFLSTSEKPLSKEQLRNSATDDLYKEITTLEKIRNDKMPINELSSRFLSAGVPLSNKAFQEILNETSTDEKGHVSLKSALLALKSSKRFQDFREVNKLANALDKVTNEKVDVDDIQPILSGLGVYFPEEESQELLSSVSVDNEGKVDLKDFLTRLSQTPYFIKDANDGMVNSEEFMGNLVNSGFSSPPETERKINQTRRTDTMEALKGEMVNIRDLDSLLGNMGIELTKEELGELSRNLPINGGEVDLSDLDNVMQNMGIELTPKEHLELVNLLPVYGLHVDVQGLDAILGNMAVKLTANEPIDLTPYIPVDEGEVVVNDMKKVPGNIGVELKEKKHDLVNNVPINGGIVDVSKLDTVLQNMGMKLIGTESKDLLENLPVDAIGQVFQNRVLDEVKSLKGGMINVNDLNKVLGNMGIKLTEKEHEALIANLPVDANGKIVLNELMDGIKTVIGEDIDISDTEGILENMRIQYSDKERLELLKKLSADGGKIDVSKLDTVLENMGMNLTEKELKDLTQSLQTDVDGKVDMKKVMDEVKAFTGGKVDISNLRPLLEKMDIKLTEKEFEQLNENLPVDADGKIDLAKVMDGVKAVTDDNKVFQNRLLEAVKSLKGKKVSVNSLSTILDNMGIKLTDEELKDLTQNLPVDVDKKSSLETLMSKVKNFKGEKVDSSDLKSILGNLGIELTEKEKEKLLETLTTDANGKVGLKEVMDGVKATTGGEVDVKDVKTTLKNMGLELTDKEYLKLLNNLPFNDENKVFRNRLLEGVKSFKVGKVNIKNLDTILNNLEIKLADSELKDLTQNIHADVDKKVSLETLMDKVTDFTGEKIESKDVKNVVKNLGIELASEELEKLMKTLPTDAAGKLYHNRLMKSVKSLKTNGNVDLHNVIEEVKGITGNVDIENLETVLGNMGIKITDEELKDLTQNLPVSVDNKVSLKTLKDEVKAFTGEKIDSSNLQNVLKDMGIELTDKELEQLMKTLPTDGGKVHVSNLDTVLEAMEVNLTEEELDHLKDLLSAYKKVDLKNVMDRIEDVTGEEVDVNDMETVLGNMGIELTDKELSELVNNLPVDRGKIDSSKVYSVLENMGMNLTEKELKDLTQNLPVDVNGKVDLEKVMNEVKPFSGDKVDTSKLENVLGNLGIKLTSNERLNLLETLPVNADGKVYQKRLMKGIKSLKRGSIDVNKLDTFLESMGINITEEEFMDLIEKLPCDDEEKIKIDTVMKELSTILGKQINVSDLKKALKDMKVEVTDKEYVNLVKTLPVDVEGKVFQKRLLDSVKNLKRGKIDMINLDTFLENMGIELSHKELEDFSQNLPVDVDGKVDLKNVTLSMKDFTGEKINASDLKNVLGDMGIEVNDKERLELLKLLPVDGDKKVFQNRLLAALKSFKGGKVDLNNLNPVLGRMGIKLRNKELKSVVKKQPIDGEKINVEDLKNILEGFGIEFTPKEYSELVKNLPVDDDGNIYENRLLDGVKSFNGGKVDVSNLEKVLRNMKIKFPDNKLKDLSQNLPVDDGKKVEKNDLLSHIKAFPGGKFHVSKLETILENLGYDLENEEVEDLRNHLPADEEKVKPNTVMENVESFKGTKINADEVDGVLKNIGIELTPKERWKLLKTLPLTYDRKYYQKRLLQGLKTFQGGHVLENKLGTTLTNLNYDLENKELNDLRNYLEIDNNGKVPLNSLINIASLFSGNKINAKDTQLYLENIGIELTKSESQELLDTLPLDGGKVNINKIDDALKNMGFLLDEEDTEELCSHLPIDVERKVKLDRLLDEVQELLADFISYCIIPYVPAAGKLYKHKLLDGIKSLKGVDLNVNKLDSFMENTGFKIEEEEHKDLLNNLPVDDEGKVDVSVVMDEGNFFTGEKVDTSNLENFLETMGIELTEDKGMELLNNLPVDGTKVSSDKVDICLKNMGIDLTEEEIQELKDHLPVDGESFDINIPLAKLLI